MKEAWSPYYCYTSSIMYQSIMYQRTKDSSRPINLEDKKMKLYQYAVLYNPPLTKEDRDAGKTAKPLILVPIASVVATSEDEVRLLAAGEIEEEYRDKLDRIQVLIRVF